MEAIQVTEDAFTGYNRISMARDLLPICKHKLEILYSVDKFACTIIIAETGSGKTTQIPQFLVEAGYSLNNHCIAVSLPRRMAAISVANRVSHELDCSLGQEVGYHVRFDNKSSNKTLIKYLTDGMLIKEMLSDPLLSHYSVIMIDDIHERTSNSDLLLGLLKKIRNKRPELKLLVSSATLDSEKIEKYFNNAEKGLESNVLHIEGRVFPVELFYLESPCRNYIVESAKIAWEIHCEKKEGDILMFLTGQEEIEMVISMLEVKYEEEVKKGRFKGLKVKLCPLYANLPLENQMEVFDITPNNTRKIIISTNLAESSVTIDNIVYVIDCCFVKLKHYDFYTDFDSLLIVPESQASANQRTGRAGRVKAGESYRLCTKEAFSKLYPCSTPEILRSRLDSILLQLKSLGVTSLSNFDFLDPPSEDSITRSLELLYSLGVLDLKGELTIDLGQKLGEFPLETRLSVMLLNSFKEEFACSEEILILVSLLASGGTIFYTNSSSGSILKAKKRFGAKEGDLITMINLFLRYNHISNRNERKKFCSENNLNENQLISAKRISEQLRCSLKTLKLTVKSSEDDIEAILRCITTAFFSHAAQRTKTGSYRGVRGAEILFLHPTSILNTSYPEWVLYYEIVRTGKVYMRECIEIDYKWLVELAPHFYQDNKASKLEERHRREVNRGEDANFKGKEGDLDKRERDLEKWTEEKPRFNRILESLKEGGVVFGKKKEVFNRKKEGSNELELKKDKKNKNTLSFDYEDI